MKQVSLSKHFGKVLGSRERAATLREELLQSDTLVQISLAGVDVLSHSFADELFGKLAEEHGMDVFRDRFQLVDLSDDHRNLIRFVIRERLSISKAV